MPKVVITPRSYGKFNQDVYDWWEQEGFEVVREIGPVPEERMKKILSDADALLIGTDTLTEATIEGASRLKMIAKYGVGIDNIPVALAERQGIEVKNTPGVNTQSVADYTFALILAAARNVSQSHAALKENQWDKQVGVEIWGKKIGILGFGAIGRAVAERAKGFGMERFIYDPFIGQGTVEQTGGHLSSFDNLMKQSDVISIHMPLTPETINLINYDVLCSMKPRSIIVNTARGGIINEKDLYHALQEGRIAGAGLDVFEEEPLRNSPLQELDNVVITPHNAAATMEATERMTLESTRAVIEFFNKTTETRGEPL